MQESTLTQDTTITDDNQLPELETIKEPVVEEEQPRRRRLSKRRRKSAEKARETQTKNAQVCIVAAEKECANAAYVETLVEDDKSAIADLLTAAQNEDSVQEGGGGEEGGNSELEEHPESQIQMSISSG